MGDLIVTENITLDGVIEATEGWFDPAGGEDDVSDVEPALRKQREAADALLLGRVTFEQMRGYWPLQTDDTIDGDHRLPQRRFEVRALQHAARPRVGAHGRVA
jgi:dihydrofolate reductase